MAVTATTVVAATTMLSAVAAVFLTFVLCFYILHCAKRCYRGGVAAWIRAGGGGTTTADGAAAWCHDGGGLDEKAMAKLPCREVGKGEALDCAVCISELAAGETARVLPRCGHAFHVACVDIWLNAHSTCPLCRCPAVDEAPAMLTVPAPEADPDSPSFPTNVLFFGSQDGVSTGRAAQRQSPNSETTAPSPSREEEAARVLGLRRLLGCGGASSLPATERDIETGLAAGESLDR